MGGDAAPQQQGRVRLPPEARKALLRQSARAVFAERGYAVSGLAEIADRAEVNKRLVYYYYPDGRSELFVAVMQEVADELLDVVRAAVSAPVNTARRTERLVDALVGFFVAQPDAFGLLFREPLGAREPEIIQEAAAVRSEVARELARLLAGAGATAPTITAVTAGAVGFILEVVDLVVTGDADQATATDACLSCMLGLMSQLGG